MEEIGRYGSADTEVKISVILECNRAKILTSVSPFSYWRCAHNPIKPKKYGIQMLQNQDFCSISVHGNEIQYRIGMWIYKIAALVRL